MQCTSPYYVKSQNIHVPCGYCRACKISKVREWSIRIAHENLYYDKSIFITLTYSNDFLPSNNSISKRELQLFFKRIRKHTKQQFKYYACGEYGDKFGRPHYHAIILGLGFDDIKLLEYCWRKGYIHTGTVKRESIQYVVGYIQKKLYGKLLDEKYLSCGLVAPFQLVSQGIGLKYIKDNQSQLEDKLSVNYNNQSISLPRYYIHKINVDEEKLKIISQEKRASLDKEILRSSRGLNHEQVLDWLSSYWLFGDSLPYYIKSTFLNDYIENTLKAKESVNNRQDL